MVVSVGRTSRMHERLAGVRRFGEVEALALSEAAPPLLYYEGRYGILEALPGTGRSPEPYPSFF